jgi:hypothetical protein
MSGKPHHAEIAIGDPVSVARNLDMGADHDPGRRPGSASGLKGDHASGLHRRSSGFSSLRTSGKSSSASSSHLLTDNAMKSLDNFSNGL